MADPRFEKASALVYDAVSLNRNSTRNILHTVGFRQIDSVSALDELEAALTAQDYDVLLCEVTSADGDIVGLLEKIRRSELGRNPFLVIVATAWQTAAATVKQVLNAGADDLIMRPFSIRQLQDRLRVHASSRKGFVVTSDYIGPDRRNDPSREGSAELLHVPNSLKMKAVDDMTAEQANAQAAREIAKMQKQVALERMKRDGFQLGILATFLEEGIAPGADENLLRADTAKALSLASDLMQRAGDAGHRSVADLCQAMSKALTAIVDSVERPKNVQLVGQLALAVQVTLSPDQTESDHVAEMAAAVSKIRDRGRGY
ncbi:MAG: response regulator [Alphaproteobacteria bacterium]|nr:response regulator [Alphaproteobacteria bacterium]